MPAVDLPIHQSTQVGKEFRWGCWNLPRQRKQITVQDGWTEDGRRITKEIEDFGSIECRNDFSLIDAFCQGCQWIGTGEEYTRQVQMRAELQSTVRAG